MYWKTPDYEYLVLGITETFSCRGTIKLDGFGKFDRSSSFLKFDKDGNLLEIMSGPVSTSVQEEFHITDIHFLSDDKLVCAHYVNVCPCDSSTSKVKISNLKKCCEKDIPVKAMEEVKLFRSNPREYEIRVIDEKLKTGQTIR